MGWVPLAVAALFVAPLWATGELGVWSFEEPRSHLLWDEAGLAPGQEAPAPAHEPGGTPGVAARFLLGLALAGVVAWSSGRPARQRRVPEGRLP